MNGPTKIMLVIAGAVALGAAAMSVPSLQDLLAPQQPAAVPSTKVKRGDVVFTVTSSGQLQGGNSRMLVAPMTGNQQLVITDLRQPGDPVKKDDIVAQFDTTDETYKLREAEADLAEAEQQVIQAESDALAKEEELNYDLVKARGEVEQAELDVRRNELLSAIAAKQNDLALEGSRDRLSKIEHDYPARKAAAKASVAMQQASRKKAEMMADTARKNIDMMTLKAPADGYINVERNTNSNFFFSGMSLPLFQVGDQVRAGMAVAQIPDMRNWEVSAQIAEEDRGHLSISQPAQIEVVALPGRKFHGKITNLGGTTGPPWERRFECKLSLDDPAAELRPGMSAQIVVTTETLKNALWIPSQAMFERDGRSFVYAKSNGAFVAKDVKLVRRSESQVVIDGLNDGEEVSMTSPDQKEQKKSGAPANAAKMVSK